MPRAECLGPSCTPGQGLVLLSKFFSHLHRRWLSFVYGWVNLSFCTYYLISSKIVNSGASQCHRFVKSDFVCLCMCFNLITAFISQCLVE